MNSRRVFFERTPIRVRRITARDRPLAQAWFSGSEALSLAPAPETEIQLPSLEAVRKATGLGDINPSEVTCGKLSCSSVLVRLRKSSGP